MTQLYSTSFTGQGDFRASSKIVSAPALMHKQEANETRDTETVETTRPHYCLARYLFLLVSSHDA